MNVLGRRGKVDGGVGSFDDLILRSIFFRSFTNVATFFNVAGIKLGFWTFAKVLIENDKVLGFFRVFSNNFL